MGNGDVPGENFPKIRDTVHTVLNNSLPVLKLDLQSLWSLQFVRPISLRTARVGDLQVDADGPATEKARSSNLVFTGRSYA